MERGDRPVLPEVQFRYQKDPAFQALVDLGIGAELSSSGYCWAACLDMALSPFVLNDEIRQGVITDAVSHTRLASGVFNVRGELSREKLGDFVDTVNECLLASNLSPRLSLIRGQGLDNYHLELQKGRIVIFGIISQKWGHVMVMDKVYSDGGKYIYALYDPAVDNPIEARQYLDNFQLYGRQQYLDTKLAPFIISVGPKEE